MRWIVDLNLFHHLEFAIVTVLAMAGMGVFLSSFIEILFIIVRVRSRRGR